MDKIAYTVDCEPFDDKESDDELMDPRTIHALSSARAAELYMQETDEDCADSNSCTIYVRDPDGDVTAHVVTTHVEVSYTSRPVR